MYSLFLRISVVLCLLFSGRTFAQKNDDRQVYLHTGTISGDSQLWLSNTQSLSVYSASKAFKPFLAIARFDRHPDEKEKYDLSLRGFHLQNYIPNRAWLVLVDQPFTLASLRAYGIDGLLALTPEMKIAPELLSEALPPAAAKVEGMADLWIRFPAYYQADDVKKWLIEENVTILSEDQLSFRILAIRIPTADLHNLAAFSFIEYIQAHPAPDQSTSVQSRINSRGNTLRSNTTHFPDGLLGNGVVVGVGDDTDPLRHIDFTGRLINRFNSVNGSGHGLHTMGIVGGGGIVREEVVGYAPKSKIISQHHSNILTYSDQYYTDFDMRLTSNSYGNAGSRDQNYRRYDLFSAILDQMSRQMPDMLHVFAAGNSGGSIIPESPYDASVTGEIGFGTVLSSYQSAKNTLTVGNLTSAFTRALSSSRGPVSAGRVKPEIMALGTSVRSAYVNNTYGSLTGTSQSAPAVAGGAALLIEQFRRQFPSEGYPSNSLLKALICNGAGDLGNSGPDYSFGYGAMNLYRSLEMLKNEHFFNGSVSSGATQNGNIVVPPNTAELKVMLYWTDPPGNPLSSHPLMNDLDLTLTVGGSEILPYVNDPEPASVGNYAVRGVDRVNNMEQIVLMNPPAGPAQFSVNGFSVPIGPQDFVLVYDLIPEGTLLTSPIGGEKYLPGDQLPIHWDSHGAATGFQVEYFNGSSWVRLVSDLGPETRQFMWQIPADLNLDKARVRVIRTSDNLISAGEDFAILGRPTVSLAASNLQCEGTFAINWTSVSNATSYQVFQLADDEMKLVATVPSPATGYSITGLSPDSTYWVSVRAVLNNSPGLRGFAISRKPDSGTCEGSSSNGDLAIVQVNSPAKSGRVHTSSALSATQPISFKVKNLDNTASPAQPATISYTVNGGASVIQNIVLPAIAPLAEHDVTFTVPANLSVEGTYEIEIELNLADDPVVKNNRVTEVFRQLPNNPVFLYWLDNADQFPENLETLEDKEYRSPSIGLSGGSRFDFESSTPGGRLRSFVNTGIANSGDRAITLDTHAYPYAPAENFLTGTYNMTDFDVNNDDIRLDFWYLQHGQFESTQSKVWVRGSDTSPWIEVYDLFANQWFAGEYKKSAGIEIADALKSAGQNFSSSTQIKWGQSGAYQAATFESINGYSFDDIRLFKAVNDVQLKAITAPQTASCDLTNQESVTVSVFNSMKTSLTNVMVFYQLNGGPVVAEHIPSLAPETLITHTFAQKANLYAYGPHEIRAWVSVSGDNTLDNNELIANIYNSPTIASFPYLETFETDEGYWRHEGDFSSWEYGTPDATKINQAASGTKAWKTGLQGNHNDREYSYLYSPCFDIGQLSNPTLSFMMALDIEDCGSVAPCDLAWVEFSENGTDWHLLGKAGEGTNWYNKDFASNSGGWAQVDFSRWHVASISLPKPQTASDGLIRIRFVMKSDIFQNREGIAIDDIHIYDKLHEISSDHSILPAVSSNISSAGNNWTTFTSGNKIVASLKPGNGTPPGLTKVQTYLSGGAMRYANNTYYHPRNFVIQPANTQLNGGTKLRLFFSDQEMESMISASNCSGCLNASSVLDLGISKFTNTDKALENDNISDNTVEGWDFIGPQYISKIPYDNGYYLEFSNSTFSEFWLSSEAIFNQNPLPVQLSSFSASLNEEQHVILSWDVSEISNFSHFEVQRARGNEALKTGFFEKIASVRPASEQQRKFQLTDRDVWGEVLYYRLKMIDLDGSYTYSDLKSVMTYPSTLEVVYPNPSLTGIFYLNYQNTGPVSYVVSDLIGKKILSKNMQGTGFPEKSILDLRNYPPGIYLIEITTNGKKNVHKMVKP